ncbi:hypothetical protein [Mycobacterium sp. TY814]|uniref:hypothetical protein n=1 Tax=unclassified Mycobacterium TaxID=2642494 RepID=UPI000F9317A5|nr:hypothetical protein [Mycobacterium sp. TY814]MDP7724034.1 hypothetical protein [Mycobacterium sp. TY814]RUP05084.1 MAG: hypothetical protein EKK34_11680 [Mycobacterium sp.]
MHHQVRAALRALARASAPRPAAARRAAKDFEKPLPAAVGAEIRWAFHPPRTWLSGVMANLVLAAAWLVVQPLSVVHSNHMPHHFHHNQLDWVVLVSTYFSSFVLADVTTTNLLGGDHYRVAQGLSDGVPLWRVLVIKNLALIVIVGLPTLSVAAALTMWKEGVPQMAMTIPNVAVPIVSWLGVGNVISVMHPVGVEPLLRRWRQRRNLRRTAGWLLAITLPYALYYVADPMGGVEHRVMWTQIPAAIGPVFGRDTKSFVHLAMAMAVWLTGTVVAVLWARKRGVRFG